MSNSTKLSVSALEIFRNFSGICNSFALWEDGSDVGGTTLKTKSETNGFIGIAKVAESFPKEFKVYDLGSFLSVVSLFKDPEIIYAGKHGKIKEKDGRNSATYSWMAETIASEKVPEVPAPPIPTTFEVTFDLSASTIKDLIKAGDVLSLDYVTFTVESKQVSAVVKAENQDGGNKDLFDVPHFVKTTGGANEAKTYVFGMKLENLRWLLTGDYDLQYIISAKTSKNYVVVKHKARDLWYFIALDNHKVS